MNARKRCGCGSSIVTLADGTQACRKHDHLIASGPGYTPVPFETESPIPDAGGRFAELSRAAFQELDRLAPRDSHLLIHEILAALRDTKEGSMNTETTRACPYCEGELSATDQADKHAAYHASPGYTPVPFETPTPARAALATPDPLETAARAAADALEALVRISGRTGGRTCGGCGRAASHRDDCKVEAARGSLAALREALGDTPNDQG